MGLINIAVESTVTVNCGNGATYFGHPDQKGLVSNQLLLTERSAEVLMNRMVAGYWNPVDQGVVIHWEINHNTNQCIARRILEASVVDQAAVIEYIPTNYANADLAFIVAMDGDGNIQFVNNMFADDPFTANFNEADLMWVNKPGLDSIIKRGFIDTASKAFMAMYEHTYNIQLMWVRIKD